MCIMQKYRKALGKKWILQHLKNPTSRSDYYYSLQCIFPELSYAGM